MLRFGAVSVNAAGKDSNGSKIGKLWFREVKKHIKEVWNPAFMTFVEKVSKKSPKRFAGKEKVRIFANRLRNNGTVH